MRGRAARASVSIARPPDETPSSRRRCGGNLERKRIASVPLTSDRRRARARAQQCRSVGNSPNVDADRHGRGGVAASLAPSRSAARTDPRYPGKYFVSEAERGERECQGWRRTARSHVDREPLWRAVGPRRSRVVLPSSAVAGHRQSHSRVGSTARNRRRRRRGARAGRVNTLDELDSPGTHGPADYGRHPLPPATREHPVRRAVQVCNDVATFSEAFRLAPALEHVEFRKKLPSCVARRSLHEFPSPQGRIAATISSSPARPRARLLARRRAGLEIVADPPKLSYPSRQPCP